MRDSKNVSKCLKTMTTLCRSILVFEEFVGEDLTESRKMLWKIREKWIFVKEKANLSPLEMFKMKNTPNELNDLAQEIFSLTHVAWVEPHSLRASSLFTVRGERRPMEGL